MQGFLKLVFASFNWRYWGVEVCACITFMSNQQKVYSLLSIVDFVCVFFHLSILYMTLHKVCCLAFKIGYMELSNAFVFDTCTQTLEEKKLAGKKLKSLIWRATTTHIPKHGRGR